MVKYENDSVHMTVNVAEDFDDASPIESHRANVVFWITAQVEALGTRQREDVVEKGIAIGKIDGTASLNWEHVRDKCLIHLPDGWFHILSQGTAARIAGECLEITFQIDNHILQLVDWSYNLCRHGRSPAPGIEVQSQTFRLYFAFNTDDALNGSCRKPVGRRTG
jgi:hypothetical protein